MQSPTGSNKVRAKIYTIYTFGKPLPGKEHEIHTYWFSRMVDTTDNTIQMRCKGGCHKTRKVQLYICHKVMYNRRRKHDGDYFAGDFQELQYFKCDRCKALEKLRG